MSHKSSRKKKRKQENIAKVQSSEDSSSKDSGLASFLKKIIEWGAYASLFTPVVVSSEFFFPFVVPKTVFFWMIAEIIFAAWVVLAISNRQFRPRWNLVSISVFVFLGVAILTSFTGINIERSFWSTLERMAGIVNWVHLVLYFIAVSSTFRTEKEWKRLVGGVLFASTVVSLALLLPKVNENLSLISFDSRKGSTIGNSSFMSAYLLFSVFLSIWLIIKENRQWLKSFYAVCVCLVVFTIFISTAYGALVSMIGGFFLILIFWLFFEKKIPFSRAIAVVLIVLGISVGGVIAWGTFTQNQAVISKLPYFFSREGTIGARKVVWDIALQGIKERPVLGWGPENFNVVFTQYFNPCLPLSECGGEIWYDRTHNIVLDQLVNSGFVGLISYMFIYIAVGYFLIKRWILRKGKRDDGSDITRKADWLFPSIIVTALASYFVQNFLVFDMINTYLMFVFILAFVSGMRSGEVSEGEDKLEARGSLIVNPLSLTLCGILLVYSLFSFGVQSLEVARWGLIANASALPPEDRLELYKKSLSVSSLGNRQIPEFFSNNTLKGLRAGDTPTPEFVFDVVEIMERTAIKENPLDYRDRMILATLYFNARRYDATYLDKAKKTFEDAMEMSPNNQQTYSSLAQIYLSTGDYKKAVEFLDKATSLEPLYVNPHLQLFDVHSGSGEYEYARTELEKGLSLGYLPEGIDEFEDISYVFEKLKEYERAIFWYSRIVENNLEEPRYFKKLGDLYRKNGNETEARELEDVARQLEDRVITK
ncbi:MAG: hypothetical protein A3B96_01125 [Candidatus Spechtbacteria bacterium RIFCSPHIGHO2_02_FULL_43_15b]|uniref:O-antigen ligase-related domain-containing protein n=1 Tax=Candidatus Spechtbacteria bacterium RIFCSPHIGHO2_01_FULL_43_30 TaxID=1802158 RepID=A0A1G2H4Q3_9BACT|nr:MAG: hypothetical protein A2827_03525 [Candidatus Spechtbacteria bacterium RIFCSPHIGHO2_01_FULL_43_30]OGZ59016.1 MAG: hypothetical protein A3B96_01125 [Candidatus Spechtbacteria bacterium RIFCSPHIGHO2_02_FULL_43_15b]